MVLARPSRLPRISAPCFIGDVSLLKSMPIYCVCFSCRIPKTKTRRRRHEARALGTFTHNGPVAVIVSAPLNDEPDEAALSDLELAIQRAAEQIASPAALSGMISGHGVLLVPLRNREDSSASRRLAEKARQLATHINHDLELVAAVGGATELETANQSYAEARRVLRLVQAVPDLGPVATWDDLGVFRVLALLPKSDLEGGFLDPRVRELLRDDGLTRTAETFLDAAGNVQKTAARLYVHRTTLYQRLDRINALYKLDLRNSGDHRLITHLGLKQARVVKTGSRDSSSWG
jgi:sugar diacid utilization regulator